MRKYFGTDGIRGQANIFPVTAPMAMRVAMATALVLKQEENGHRPRVLIGKDTRLSGYMIEQAMTAGFLAMGMDVILSGPLPTPAIAMLTRSLRADAGVMISASHNPYQDNGIKIFSADGYKLPDQVELEIEKWLDRDDLDEQVPPTDKLGKATRLEDLGGRYNEFLKSSLPRGMNFKGLKVVVDAAHGAAYKIAPQIFWELEAEVVVIGTSPNGRNINDGVGATAVQALQEKVLSEKADLGIALDGDADRLILVDEKGTKIDGDQILALLALNLSEKDQLYKNTVVATVMSNLGLERFLKEKGITLLRTPVGDRYVVEEMRAHGYNLGGEQSGHMILSDFGTTGDGLMTALQVTSILKETSKLPSEQLSLFTPLPQLLKNVRYTDQTPLDRKEVQEVIEQIKADLNEKGRILVRASGTEPVIRVMAEGDDHVLIEQMVNRICSALEEAS
jgi:phosphoglucosamine mutase